MPKKLDSFPPKVVIEGLIQKWQKAGILSDDGREGGPKSQLLFKDGFKGFSVLRSDTPRFVANQMGGFRVFCGSQNITGLFVSAMGRWRAGGVREMDCACGISYPLEDLDFRPPAGFYRVALEFRRVGHAELEPQQLDIIEGLLGPVRVVYRRIG